MQSNDSDRLNVMVSTRFGVGVTDQAWLEHRFLLFEAITAPSLRNQTCRDFVWNIFVGEQAEAWVVDRLKRATDGIGKRVVIHRRAQNHKDLQQCSECHPRGATHTLLLLIDDDDAWCRNYVDACTKKGLEHIRNGRDRVAFTFANGLEWLVTELVDIDALLGKQQKIIRQRSAYYYFRPFLTMAVAILSPANEVPKKFVSVHGTRGECLVAAGYLLDELTLPVPAWLYVRHRQADSTIRKAHEAAPLDLGLEQLEAQFGVSAPRLEAYRKRAADFGYSRKRVHQEEDKSDLCLAVEEDEGFRKEAISNRAGLIRVAADDEAIRLVFFDEAVIRGKKVRVVAYDGLEKAYTFKKVYERGFTGLIEPGELVLSADLKIKVQFFDEAAGRWADASPYVKATSGGS